ncbi:MAG: hypothetical protein TH68_05995, partial [Candidatus Synechococcus spongiarum 142]
MDGALLVCQEISEEMGSTSRESGMDFRRGGNDAGMAAGGAGGITLRGLLRRDAGMAHKGE